MSLANDNCATKEQKLNLDNYYCLDRGVGITIHNIHVNPIPL